MNSRLLPSPIPLSGAWHDVASVGRRVAFWAAVLLPLAYVPLLSSPIDDAELLTLAALITVHVACLLAGHDYSP
jgi:uncharacterized membrane protein required for colicin V production